MDLLSQLLCEVRVEASAMALLSLRSPFHLHLRYEMPYSMIVLEGHCDWVDETAGVHRLEQGDSILVLQPVQCALGSHVDQPATSFETAWQANQLPSFTGSRDFSTPLRLAWGGGGPACELLGIAFAFELRNMSPILAYLPPSLVVPRSRTRREAGIDAAIAFLTSEGEQAEPGYAALAAHHAETVFLGLLRTHALSGPVSTRSLLAGLRDPHLAAALNVLHADPSARWTVARLAQAAALSRSVFAERFAAAIGLTPMQYAGWVRMRTASRALRDGNTSIAALADQMGYASERAFRAAFERHIGRSPSEWRRTARRED